MGASEWEREKKERERGGGNEGIIETDKEIERRGGGRGDHKAKAAASKLESQ